MPLRITSMKATLWDGSKQLHGKLELLENGLFFSLTNFSKSNLNLDIPYKHIESLRIYRVYKLSLEGLEIVTKDGKQNVFVMEEAKEIKKSITDIMNLRSKFF